MPVLTIEFDNEKALYYFKSWLCESGEQDYWEWMKYREREVDGKITALRFDYHVDGEFYNSNKILTKCGRLDDPPEIIEKKGILK